jgi:hypothetical protein
VRGQRVPEHIACSIPIREAETLHKLLTEVRADEQFPLNEHEDEVLRALIELLES